MEKNIYNLWFSQIKGIGNNKKIEIMKKIESTEKIFRMDREELEKYMGKGNKIIDILLMNRNLDEAKETLEIMDKRKVSGLSYFDKDYPERLKEIYNPPLYLYMKGELLKKKEEMIPSVAIVGARKGTSYGKYTAYQIAKKLVQYEVTVVSGMAFGIDSYAHKGALENKGNTIAVLGCGVNVCYPKENEKLMEEIVESGAVISEYHPNTQPFPAYFPQRNRIISGLSQAVAIIEAGERSGSLITAEHALEQGKDIYALPGNINSVYSKGTNKLIKEGAIPICSIEDFIRDLNLINEMNEGRQLDLGEDESMVYRSIKSMEPVYQDALAIKLKKEISQISGIITILEIKGLIKSTYNGIISIK